MVTVDVKPVTYSQILPCAVNGSWADQKTPRSWYHSARRLLKKVGVAGTQIDLQMIALSVCITFLTSH